METKFNATKVGYDGIKYHVHRSHVPTHEAEFAMFLMDKGQLTSVHLKHDMAGRSVPEFLPPQAIVERACEISRLAFEEFHKRGWLIETNEPTEDQLKKFLQD